MCVHAFDVPYLSLNFARCSVVGAARGRCSVAQEPGGGTSDRGAGFQRSHAADAKTLCRTHSCHPHSAIIFRCCQAGNIFLTVFYYFSQNEDQKHSLDVFF